MKTMTGLFESSKILNELGEIKFGNRLAIGKIEEENVSMKAENGKLKKNNELADETGSEDQYEYDVRV